MLKIYGVYASERDSGSWLMNDQFYLSELTAIAAKAEYEAEDRKEIEHNKKNLFYMNTNPDYYFIDSHTLITEDLLV